MSREFRTFVEELGLLPGAMHADGKWRRCPTRSHRKSRNGAYKLEVGGQVGWAQDWSTMAQPVRWTSAGGKAEPVVLNKEAMKESHRKAMQERDQAIARAKEFYAACKPLRNALPQTYLVPNRNGHPYLEQQDLSMLGCHRLAVDDNGWLVIPAYLNDQVVSYQRISPTGQKLFAKGAPIQGTYFPIFRRNSTLTVITEGVATGLAIFQAIPDASVLVTWSTSNLVREWKIPAGWRVVAADNDHGTQSRTGKNPGIEAGLELGKLLDCGVAYPTGIQGTDWADYARERVAGLQKHAQRYTSTATLRKQVGKEIAMWLMGEAKYHS